MTWHFPICSDGASRNPQRLPAARLTTPLRSLPPAVRLRSLLTLLPPVERLRLLPPAALLTNRKKSLLHAVPRVAPATSNRGFAPKSVPGGKVLAGNPANHSVIPLAYIPEDKVMMI